MKKFLILFLIFVNSNLSAQADINKNISLNTGYSYVLVFEHQILDYRLGNEKFLQAELLASIFSDKTQLVLKPIEDADTNLLVWTQNGIYNFNINIKSTKNRTSNIINIKTPKTPSELQKQLGNLKLDEPPVNNGKVFDFEIDKPPMGVK
ncbi:MAG: hypothetical protein PHV68_02565 [Candidatus Gastranaerophilales bacterium]|nr:hypothetical protein [Candidatus Gastranaerophilales bacterium]